MAKAHFFRLARDLDYHRATEAGARMRFGHDDSPMPATVGGTAALVTMLIVAVGVI